MHTALPRLLARWRDSGRLYRHQDNALVENLETWIIRVDRRDTACFFGHLRFFGTAFAVFFSSGLW
jgi:hypothetical protein